MFASSHARANRSIHAGAPKLPKLYTLNPKHPYFSPAGNGTACAAPVAADHDTASTTNPAGPSGPGVVDAVAESATTVVLNCSTMSVLNDSDRVNGRCVWASFGPRLLPRLAFALWFLLPRFSGFSLRPLL